MKKCNAAKLIIFLLLTQVLAASMSAHPFVLVMVDVKTEVKIGAFPFDRAVYARAIKACRLHGARSVVIKYFLDLPRSKKGDMMLAAEMGKIPVFLQAGIVPEERNPNAFPVRFNYAIKITNTSDVINGRSGWIPLERFSGVCAGLGFVNVGAENLNHVPIVVGYRNRYAKSLWLVLLEHAFNSQARIIAGTSITLHNKTLQLTRLQAVKVTLPDWSYLQYFSFIDLLENRIPRSALMNKIVILAYDGGKQSSFQVGKKRIKAHRLFYCQLLGLHGLMQ